MHRFHFEQVDSEEREVIREIVANVGDGLSTVRKFVSKVPKKVRQLLCPVISGGHELYRARTDTKMYQKCLLCGYETKGWTIDRRDRKGVLSFDASQHNR